ncbi:MAG: leucyl aminopeptidase [Cytophagales bacterium]|nr:MAG: leucyl aminopeptidase [Cytophagales bacterium]TAF61243.1 MAG: leucyl aminopeptidase [Cytophagales bacterium]
MKHLDLKLSNSPRKNTHLVLFASQGEVASAHMTSHETEYVVSKIKDKEQELVTLNQYNRYVFVIKNELKDENKRLEAYRSFGDKIAQTLAKIDNKKIDCLGIDNPEDALALVEGLVLGSYIIPKYGNNAKPSPTWSVLLNTKGITKQQVSHLEVVLESVFIARDLVNSPYNFLNATQLASRAQELAALANFKIEVFGKERIKALKMGGLLAVNQGSVQPPTFTVMEYKPSNAINKQPYVVVGKGVTFDSGGMNIKTPWNYMREMKSDMAGAAATISLIYAVAKAQLPLYVVGLVPSTDNQTDSTAVMPGDVITISNGKTVEVLNTDAEGRLILADALSYAQKYKPLFVVDLATLTGSAANAIGQQASVCMGTASEDMKAKLKAAGNRVHERLVEFPLYEEYRKGLESEVADMTNIPSSPEAGAIIGGIFLENFVDYPWMHFDIAGTAFLGSKDAYRSKNGTGVGVRLLFEFFKNIAKG